MYFLLKIKIAATETAAAQSVIYFEIKRKLTNFSLKFVNEMKKHGISLKREIRMEKVVDELCRLRLEN